MDQSAAWKLRLVDSVTSVWFAAAWLEHRWNQVDVGCLNVCADVGSVSELRLEDATALSNLGEPGGCRPTDLLQLQM